MESLRIGDREFRHVRSRMDGPVNIYKGEGAFLRLGSREDISREKAIHERFLSLGSPVAKILESGELDGKAYFIEESLGEEHFGEIFARDCAETGSIRKESFGAFLDIVSRYAEAQLREKHPMDFEVFLNLIHREEILSELPQLADLSNQALARVQESVKDIPAVPSHGDFNPHNILPKGCIDLEKFAMAPAGYDIVSCITQITNFPTGEGFEIRAGYSFSKEQIEEYFEAMDAIYSKNGLDPVSRRKKEFSFCRNIWSVVRMQRWPKLQAWRYAMYEGVLKDMLK